MSSSQTIEPVPTQRRGFLHLASAWLPVVVCIFVISQESTATFGADHTSGPLQRFFEFFLGHLSQPVWWRLHIFVRKCGHFTGYGILSIACFRAFWMTVLTALPFPRRRITCHGLAMLGTLLVASADEFHQTFLPNRTGTGWDVLVDCSGALLLQWLVWLWMRKRFPA